MEVIETRNSMTHQLYARDLVITAVICFIGGIGFAVLIVLIYYTVFLRKKKKDGKMEEAEEGNSTMANQPDVGKWRNHIHPDNSLTFDREVVTLDPWTCDPVHQFNSRTVKNDDQVWPSNCCTEDHRGRWNNRTKAQLETDEEIERRRVRMMVTEHDLRRFATQQGFLEFTNKRSHSRTSSHPGKEAVVRRVEAMITNREEEYGPKAQGGRASKRNKVLYCNGCHRTFGKSEPNMRKGRVHTKIKDYGDFPFQHTEIDRDLNIGNTSDTSKNMRVRRRSRNVTFNLESLRHSKQQNSQSEDEKSSRDEERAGKHNSRVPLRRLKVKFDFNPRGKSKIHPKRRNEHGHSDRSRSKRSKGKRVTGKDTTEKGKMKERHPKRKTFDKVKGLVEDVEEHKEENSRQIGEKTKIPSGVPENSAADQHAKECHAETSQSVENTHTEQLPSPVQHPRDGCIQQHKAPPQVPTSVDNSTSLRDKGFFQNTTTTGAGSLDVGWKTNSVSPSTAINTSSMAPNGAPDTFNGQEHLLTPASVLPASVLPSPSLSTSPILATQSKDLFPSTMNSNVFQQSLPTPSGSSPFVEKVQSDPALEPGPQPGIDHLTSEAPQNGENMKEESSRAARQSVETENDGGAGLAEILPLTRLGGSTSTGEEPLLSEQANPMSTQFAASADVKGAEVLQQQEDLPEERGSSLRRKLRLVLPEKRPGRPLTALERKIR